MERANGSVAAMAELTGVPHQTLTNYLNIGRTPGRELVKRLADGLGVSVDEVLWLAGYDVPDAARASDVTADLAAVPDELKPIWSDLIRIYTSPHSEARSTALIGIAALAETLAGRDAAASAQS